MTDKLWITIRCHWYRVSTKWLFWLRKNLHYFAQKFCLGTFAHLLRMESNEFWAFLRNFVAQFAQNWKYYTKPYFLSKLSKIAILIKELTTEDLFTITWKKWIRLYYSRLITFSTSLMTIVGRNRQQFWYFTLFLNC